MTDSTYNDDDVRSFTAKLHGLELTEGELAFLSDLVDRACAIDDEVSGFSKLEFPVNSGFLGLIRPKPASSTVQPEPQTTTPPPSSSNPSPLI